jgi:dTDP-4-dehydrorhamnose reductase
MTRILLRGKTGQVGYELERGLQGLGEIIALGSSEMDVANLGRVRDVIRAIKPNLISSPLPTPRSQR